MLKKSGIAIISLVVLASCGSQNSGRQSFLQTDLRTTQMNVIDGQVVTELQSKAARSVIAVELLDKNRRVLTYCTGVLIGQQTVLTAAHCMSENVVPNVYSFNIVFDTQTKNVSSSERRHGFEFQVHPQYNSEDKTWIYMGDRYLDLHNHPELQSDLSAQRSTTKQGDHDLAVLVFRGTIPSGYAPVSIDTDLRADYSGKTIYIYGFGRAKDYLDINGSSDTTTGQLRRGTVIVDSDFHAYADRYFTAHTSKNSLCQGDSGGPQFYNENGVLKIIGINSAVAGDEGSIPIDKSVAEGNLISCRGRSQVAKVAPYADWIQNVSKQMVKDAHE